MKSTNEREDEVPCAAWLRCVDVLHPGHMSPRRGRESLLCPAFHSVFVAASPVLSETTSDLIF